MTIDAIHQKYKKLTEYLIENKLSVSTMESCTSGFIASLITDTEGASAIFKGAFVTYSNEAKIMNGVGEGVINEYGVYSSQTAAAMAEAACKKYNADIGIGVTGSFGNVDPNNEDSVPGQVYFCIRIKEAFCSRCITLPKNISRYESKLYVADCVYAELAQALNIL